MPVPRWAAALIAGVVFFLLDKLLAPALGEGAYIAHVIFMIVWIVCFLAAAVLLLLWLFGPSGRYRDRV